MGYVDVQRAFRSMTLPAPKSGEPHERRPVVFGEDVEPVATPIETGRAVSECPDLESLSEDEQDAQMRRVVTWLSGVLRLGPQPLSLVLDLLECNFDVPSCCAEGLFWQAHERGYVSLREGEVYLGRLSAAR